jgi:HD-like signal output (HDOD) protein
VLAALSAEAAGPVCGTPIPAAAYTAALLHDLGKLVLGRFLAPEDRTLLERAIAEAGTDAADAEVEILSLHHGEVGAVIAQHWQLPDSIVQGVLYHHHPQERGETICYVTYLADVVAHTVAAGEVLPARGRKHLAPTMEWLGLTPAGFERLCATVAGRFEGVSARYN